MGVFQAYVYLCITFVSTSSRGQKKVLNYLELES